MRVLVVDDHKNTRESLALGARLVIKPVTAKDLAVFCAPHAPVATAKGTRK